MLSKHACFVRTLKQILSKHSARNVAYSNCKRSLVSAKCPEEARKLGSVRGLGTSRLARGHRRVKRFKGQQLTQPRHFPATTIFVLNQLVGVLEVGDLELLSVEIETLCGKAVGDDSQQERFGKRT